MWYLLIAVLIMAAIGIPKGIEIMNDRVKERYLLYREKAKLYADRYQIPVPLMFAIIEWESGWNPRAYRQESHLKPVDLTPYDSSATLSSDGSYGLGQLLYSTAKGLGYSGDAEGLYDPDVNLHLTANLLRILIKETGGNTLDILAKYNSGRVYDKAPQVAKDYALIVSKLMPKYQTEVV